MSRHFASVLFLVLVSMFWLPSNSVYGQSATDNGHISVLSAQLRDSANGWELSAEVEIVLSREIRQGLESGVPLQFIVEFNIKRARTLWLDKTLLESEHRFSLIYYELTRHYRLQSVNTKKSRNYRSLLNALDDLSHFQNLVVDRPDDFDDVGTLTGQVSVRLDGKTLPLPLQPLLSSTWRLASEEFTWSLN